MWGLVAIAVVVVLAASWLVVLRRTAVPRQMGPAGWYSDPAGSGRRRWFDGVAWTDRFEDVAVPRSSDRAA